MLPAKVVAFWSKSNFLGKKKKEKRELKPWDAGVGIIIDLKLSRDYSEWWQALILQGFRCLFCSAGVCECTGRSGGLCPGGFRGGCGMARSCAVGTAGWDAALTAPGSNSCCWVEYKPQHFRGGQVGFGCLVQEQQPGEGRRGIFPNVISVLFCKCENWEWLVPGLCWEVGCEEPQGKLAEIKI